jgi:hypothetical protein
MAHVDTSSEKPTYAQEGLYDRLASDVASGRRINEKDKDKLTKGQITNLNNVEYKEDGKSARKYRDLSAGDTGNPILNMTMGDSLATKKILIERNFEVLVNESNSDGTRKYSDMQASELAVTKWKGSVEYVAAQKTVERIIKSFKEAAPDFNPDTHNVDEWMKLKGKKIDDKDDFYRRLKRQYESYQDAKKKIVSE